MTTPPEATPFLAQVPVAELVPHLSAGGHACSAPPTTVRRRRGLSRVGKRLASVLFLGLGIMSMLSLGRGAASAVSDGLSGDDTVVLAMLGLISVVVASQAFSLLRALPGTRNIWKWVARARQRRTAPTAGRPLLAQADARAVLPHLPAATPRDGGGRLRPAARTAGWVALTLVIMAAAIAGAGLVGVSAIRSVDARGWGLGTIVGLAVAALIGYGLTAMSIGLIRSWFEVRRRRMRRMLMRLLRYLLRGFDRSAAAAHHLPAGVQGATGVLGHGALATGGAAVVVAASLVMPVSALEGTVTNAHDPGSTSTSIVHAVNVDHGAAARFAPAGSESEDGAADVLVSDPRQDGFTATTLAPIAADTTSTTGAHATAATARTPTKTSVTSKPTTTTTTTVAPRDATGPVVSRISDGPDPIFTAGNKPDTTQINFTTSDTSGVATVNIYYRLGSGSFALWATPKPGTASTTFGPFAKTGTYEYRIRATDTLGNTNCKTPATCPGGTVTVTTNTKPTTTTTTTATTTTTTTVAPGK